MTHTYKLRGMTCSGCAANAKSSLLTLPGITSLDVSLPDETVTISMDKHVALSAMQKALSAKYTISPIEHRESVEQAKSWFQTYKPVLLLFGYITAIAIITASKKEDFNWMLAMNVFMSGFFLSFSLFKLLDLKGFAESYAMYDLIAGKFRTWGLIYPFIELALGISFAAGFSPLLTNIVTLIVMSVSILGVIKSILSKRKIRCACLGAVFNLPMSTVTLIEDALMIIMSAGMLFVLLN